MSSTSVATSAPNLAAHPVGGKVQSVANLSNKQQKAFTPIEFIDFVAEEFPVDQKEEQEIIVSGSLEQIESPKINFIPLAAFTISQDEDKQHPEIISLKEAPEDIIADQEPATKRFDELNTENFQEFQKPKEERKDPAAIIQKDLSFSEVKEVREEPKNIATDAIVKEIPRVKLQEVDIPVMEVKKEAGQKEFADHTSESLEKTPITFPKEINSRQQEFVRPENIQSSQNDVVVKEAAEVALGATLASKEPEKVAIPAKPEATIDLAQNTSDSKQNPIQENKQIQNIVTTEKAQLKPESLIENKPKEIAQKEIVKTESKDLFSELDREFKSIQQSFIVQPKTSFEKVSFHNQFNITRYFAESLPEISEAGGDIEISPNGSLMVDFATKQEAEFENLMPVLDKTPLQAVKQISLAVKHGVNLGKSEINIILHPRTLGVVEVKIELVSNHNGSSEIQKIEILADRKETLELLKQSQGELKKSLEQVPEIKKEADLHFGQRDDQNHGQQQNQAHLHNFSNKQNNNEIFNLDPDFSDIEKEQESSIIKNDEYITEHSVNIRV